MVSWSEEKPLKKSLLNNSLKSQQKIPCRSHKQYDENKNKSVSSTHHVQNTFSFNFKRKEIHRITNEGL